jgi:lysyl-tRNA synthetase class 2
MKRLLSTGLAHIYELGRVFRAGENGAWHNPEFTLLEWYHKDWNYLDLATEVVDLIRYCGPGRFDQWPARQISYRDLFLQYTGLDPFLADDADWSILAGERGIDAGQLDQQQWLDLVISLIIQPTLDPECILTVFDYPTEQAALACIRNDNTPVAERFEIYLGRVELANGYQELGDAAEQLQRFERENRLRKIQGENPPPIDMRMIQALEHGFPRCAGVALGVDRLLMCLLELEDISAVLAFPHDRA